MSELALVLHKESLHEPHVKRLTPYLLHSATEGRMKRALRELSLQEVTLVIPSPGELFMPDAQDVLEDVMRKLTGADHER